MSMIKELREMKKQGPKQPWSCSWVSKDKYRLADADNVLICRLDFTVSEANATEQENTTDLINMVPDLIISLIETEENEEGEN